MRFSWSETRKYDATKLEEKFEKKLAENGYTIIAYKECWSKTDYRIAKDGIEIEYSVYKDSDNSRKVNMIYSFFEDYYNLKKQVMSMEKKQLT